MLPLILSVAVLVTAADERGDGGFARVEVRGKLEPWTFHFIERDRYAVSFKDKSGVQQQFVLDLPDEATKKLAKGLVGGRVVVTGDISQRKEGDGKRVQAEVIVMVVSVKSLKKAEPVPKP